MMGPEPRLTPALLEEAVGLVRARTGLVFGGQRTAQFTSGFLTGMRRAGVAEPAEYLARLSQETGLLDALAAEITVGESYFLRDAAQWELLRTQLLPRLLERTGRDLRIWSAGCASGEEPYSIALLLDQFGAAGRARILATDISRPALARAAHGVYGPWSLRDVPEDVRRRYFRDTGRQFEIMPALRSQVELRHHNLASTTWPTPADGLGSMDLILCRNVLIYFDQATVTRVAGRLLDCLAEDGCLVLGASDPIIAGLVPCEVEITEAGLVYHRSLPARHAAPRSEPAAPPHPARVLPRKTSPTARSLRDGPGSPAPDALSEARSRYAERDYAGAAEVVLAALELGERSAALEILLVRSLANRGQLSDAGRACAAALDVYRSEPELVVLHAVLLAHAGYHAEAADALRRALYLDRHLAVAHLALGETLARLGDREGAVRELRAARQLLEQLPGEQPVTASDGEPAARLAELVRTHLQLLEGSAA